MQLPCWQLNWQHDIYSQRNAGKKLWNNKGLYVVFVDFSKAFNTVNRWTLWKVLKAYGCPEFFTNMIRQFHDDMIGRMSIGGDISDAFPIKHRVKQGYVLAPTLFIFYHGAVLETMSTNLASGVYIQTHLDGKLFNLACLKAETRLIRCVSESCFMQMTWLYLPLITMTFKKL